MPIESGPILLVIDMQPKFRASRKASTLKNCLREIEKAVKAHQRIFVVEYANEGPSHVDITDLLSNYDRVAYITKHGDDGSKVILDYLKEFKRDMGKLSFTVCGVNTDCCVKWTVLGIAQKRKDATIRVVKDACNQPSTWRKRKPFERMQEAKNVKVV